MPSWKKLIVSGSDANLNSLTIATTLTASVKSFLIDHPSKSGYKLQYGVLEGPEHSVFIRGKNIKNKKIVLPYYWKDLIITDSITVNLTSIGKYQKLWVQEITDEYIIIESSIKKPEYFYTVFAERKDIKKLETEIKI